MNTNKSDKDRRKRTKTEASEATAEEIAEVERRYGQTIDELVEEAERGYDLSRMRPIHQRRK